MTSLSRADHLDSSLTGLTLLESYKNHDPEAFEAIVATATPSETIFGLLHAMDLLTSIFASKLGTDPEQVIASMRRHMVTEMGRRLDETVEGSPPTP